MNPIQIFTAIDLEFNQPSNKIIQIGACIFNISTSEIISKLSIHVNPNEALSDFITQLTGINQEHVDSGKSLIDAYSDLVAFHKHHKSFCNPVTWGQGDLEAIRAQVMQGQLGNPGGWPFGRRIIDTKTLFVSWRLSQGIPIQGGLARSMLKVGLKFEGAKHDALDDAINTARMYVAMLTKFKS